MFPVLVSCHALFPILWEQQRCTCLSFRSSSDAPCLSCGSSSQHRTYLVGVAASTVLILWEYQRWPCLSCGSTSDDRAYLVGVAEMYRACIRGRKEDRRTLERRLLARPKLFRRTLPKSHLAEGTLRRKIFGEQKLSRMDTWPNGNLAQKVNGRVLNDRTDNC